MDIERAKKRIEAMVLEEGFEPVAVNGFHKDQFKRGDMYCIVEYAGRLGFILSYARGLFEAEHSMHEDGDCTGDMTDEAEIVEFLRFDLRRSIGVTKEMGFEIS